LNADFGIYRADLTSPSHPHSSMRGQLHIYTLIDTPHLIKLNALLQELNRHVIFARLDVDISQEKPTMLNLFCILSGKQNNRILYLFFSIEGNDPTRHSSVWEDSVEASSDSAESAS